ncbi:MAG: hypothetical protein IT379_17935 [Deltaproteobacteria bacterium]|nr:hypothetical protein [Deltaproteobacteria bacterium]
MKLELHPDWHEFLRLLIAHRVKFLVVGGHAVAAHGAPRLTQDLDVLFEPTLANSVRLRDALIAFGFGDVAPEAGALTTRGKVWMLGRAPQRIDLLPDISGVSFPVAWRTRVEVDLDGTHLPVIGRAQLISNKRAAGRAKDLADVEALSPAKRRAGRLRTRKR